MYQDSLKKVTVYSIVLMVVTSLHHIYGAWIYSTPWRMHVLMLSIPVIILTALLHQVIKKEGASRFIFWLYWGITLVPSLAMIGLFEGLYNHVVKNILYFAGAGRSLLDKLYQPGIYELPNDFLFEFTGILQGLIVLPLAVHFVRLARSVLPEKQAA